MLTNLFQKIADAWRRISPREQRLAMAIGVLAGVLLLLSMARGAYEHVTAMDNRIVQLQDNILTFHRQIATKKSVEAQYAGVAAQHSSHWSEPEILDRLRAEINRLAQAEPPPLDENGTPVKTTSDSGILVDIPSLQPGTLNDSAEGYREYRITVNVPLAKLDALLTFLERLQASPQSLRLDVVDIARDPLHNMASAKIELTRIVVSGTDEPVEKTKGAQLPPRINREEIMLKEWRAEGGTIEELPGDDPSRPRGITLAAEQPGAELFFKDVFSRGATYDLFLDASVAGKASIAIEDMHAGQVLPGAQSAREDGNAYKYHIEFTVPDSESATVELRVPVITAEDPGARITVYSLRLKKRDN